MMENFREKYTREYLKLLDDKWNHLTDKERNDVIFLRNQKSLTTQNFNKLKTLAERFRTVY
jgi:hypothetical protein